MNPYHELSLEQAQTLKAEYDERYWDASDMLASIIVERQKVAEHIKDLLEQERGVQSY